MVTPKNMRVRPTSDRVKEAIFNILGNHLDSFDKCRVLDIFAGTGNLGIEALSRGASSAVFIENHRDSVLLIEKNLQLTGFAATTSIIHKDVPVALHSLSRKGMPFQLIFLDPPYEQGLMEKTLEALGTSTLVEEGTIVVAEFSTREPIAVSFGCLREIDRRIYGDTTVSLLTADTPKPATDAGCPTETSHRPRKQCLEK